MHEFINYVKTTVIAIFRGGSNDGATGRNGNTVTYLLYGKLVKRTIGLRTDKPTIPVLKSRQITALATAFLKPVKEFVAIGFELEGRLNFKSYYDIASSYNISENQKSVSNSVCVGQIVW